MFLGLQDMLAKMCFDESGDVKAGSLEHLEDVDPNAMMYVLTNSNQVNGAVYMCDEEVMSLIAEKLGYRFNRDSVIDHETIILKETENMSVRRTECDGRGSKCGSRGSTGKAGEFCLPI